MRAFVWIQSKPDLVPVSEAGTLLLGHSAKALLDKYQ